MTYKDPPYEHPGNTHGAEFIALINLWRKDLIDYLRLFSGRQVGASSSITANQSILAGVYTLVDFDSEDWDIGGNYSTTNKRYTLGTDEGGRYRISGHLTFLVGSDQDQLSISIYINGANVHFVQKRSSGASTQTVMFNRVLNISDGDYIEIYARNAGSNDTIQGGSLYGSFQVEFLGT